MKEYRENDGILVDIVFGTIWAVVILIVGVGYLGSCGCAQAATRSVAWTYPITNQAGLGVCAAGQDSCKDLARVRLVARLVGATDTSIVLDRAVTFAKAGQADSTNIERPDGTIWDFWMLALDQVSNASCRSNVIRLVFETAPSAPTVR